MAIFASKGGSAGSSCTFNQSASKKKNLASEPRRCFRRTSDRLRERNRTLYLLNGLARFNEVSRERGSNYARNSLETLLRLHLSGRIFCSSDCLASAQSCANQFSRLRGVVETTFSHRIASHSPFESDWK